MANIYSTDGISINGMSGSTTALKLVSVTKLLPSTGVDTNIINFTISPNPTYAIGLYINAYLYYGNYSKQIIYGWSALTGGTWTKTIETFVFETGSNYINYQSSSTSNVLTLKANTTTSNIYATLFLELMCNNWNNITISYP